MVFNTLFFVLALNQLKLGCFFLSFVMGLWKICSGLNQLPRERANLLSYTRAPRAL